MPAGVTAIRGTITGTTVALPPVITSAAHGLSNGDIIRITQVGGSIGLNNHDYRISNTTTNTFELQDEETHLDIDGRDFSAYTTGGRWNKLNRVDSDRVFFNP